MSSWHKIILAQSQVGAGVEGTIMNEFMQRYLRLGSPSGMALFSTPLINRQSSLYFSPDCSPTFDDLVATYSGFPCGKPTEPVSVLVGQQGDEDRFGLVKDVT
jgi:hypothetical protein